MVTRHAHGTAPDRSLGSALRDWRERVDPAALGLVVHGRRRAPGLRRQELAELAGVSEDYVKRLEQGRGHPSATVLTALARALRLDRADYEYLCALAGLAPAGDGQVPKHLGPGARRLLERLDATAVCICDAAWNALAWNPAWQVLGCDTDRPRGRDLNLAWRIFTVTADRAHRTPHRQARFEATLTTDLRSAARRYPADQDLVELIEALKTRSTSFRERWQDVSTARYEDDQATFTHPVVGDITLDFDILTLPEGNLRAVVLTAPPGSTDADRLRAAGLMLSPVRGDELGQAPAAVD